MATNHAAFLMAKQERPLKVIEAPMPELREGHIIIKTRGIAVNPADAMIQTTGMIAKKYPTIMGLDGSGEVHAVHPSVTRFKPGERVMAMPLEGITEGCQQGTFQQYFLADTRMVAHLPDNVDFAEGALFPSCLSVAAYALFTPGTLGLTLPPASGKASANGKWVLIWAGTSVVGSHAIQLAKIAGYDVAATCSPRNFDYCRSVGADQVFNYKDADVVDQIVKAGEGKQSVGAFNAYYNDEATVTCSKILSRVGGIKKVATVVPPFLPKPEGIAEGVEVATSKLLVVRIRQDICTYHYLDMQTDLAGNDIGQHFWRDGWITRALAEGTLACKPEATVVGTGLEHVQEAMDKWSAGASAQKFTVLLDA